MKYLKYALFTLAGLIVVALIIPAITNKDYHVEKEVVIQKPVQTVFSFIKPLKNQEKFSVWAKMDPQMERTYRGSDGTVGFVAAWKSDKEDVGKGEQEIKSIKENERIDYELRFLEPFEATDQAYMVTQKVSANETIVKWGFNGAMSYPMNIMLLFMDMEQMIGGDLETGLQNLKGILEGTSNNQ